MAKANCITTLNLHKNLVSVTFTKAALKSYKWACKIYENRPTKFSNQPWNAIELNLKLINTKVLVFKWICQNKSVKNSSGYYKNNFFEISLVV